MTDLASRSGFIRRRWPWRSMLEERFTNIDLVMVLAALAFTGVISVLGGLSLSV